MARSLGLVAADRMGLGMHSGWVAFGIGWFVTCNVMTHTYTHMVRFTTTNM